MSTDALVRGIFFLLLLVPFTRTLEPETETAAPRRSKANAVLSRSLPLTLFFNRSLITKTRHLYTYAHLLHSPVILYYDKYSSSSRSYVYNIYYYYYNSSHTHTTYNGHEGRFLTTAAAGSPLQERPSMDIYLYYYHFFFVHPHSRTNAPFPGNAFMYIIMYIRPTI